MEKTLKSKIEYILQEFPDTRNSDIELMIKIIRRYYIKYISTDLYGIETMLLANLRNLPREDHIERIRAKFNSVGKYLPTKWEVAKARRINEEVWKEAMRVKSF